MTKEEVVKLESILNKKLPKFYEEFLLNYPEDLVDLGSPYNTVSDLSLPNTVDRLIEISDFENPPVNILIIGVDGMGNCYYINLNNDDQRIYLFNHEMPAFLDDKQEIIDWDSSFEGFYENLNDFISDLKLMLVEENYFSGLLKQ